MTFLRERQWNFHFSLSRNHGEPVVCVCPVPIVWWRCHGVCSFPSGYKWHGCVAFIRLSVSGAHHLADSRDWPTRWMTLRGRRAVGTTPKSIPVSGRPRGICTATAGRLDSVESDFFSGCGNKHSNNLIICINRHSLFQRLGMHTRSVYSTRKECVLMYCLSGKSAQLQSVRKLPTVML